MHFMFSDVINDSDLSANANEFVPTPFSGNELFDAGFEVVQSNDIIEPEKYIQNETIESVKHDDLLISTDASHVDPEPYNAAELIKTEASEIEALIAPIEPQNVVAPAPEPLIEPIVEIDSKPAIIAATVVATAAAVGIAKAPLKKSIDAKKTDVKSKVAPIKKTTTSTITSKVAAKTGTVPSKTTAPKVASRTIAPKVSTVTEKKTSVTSTTARKPLSNGSMYYDLKSEHTTDHGFINNK